MGAVPQPTYSGDMARLDRSLAAAMGVIGERWALLVEDWRASAGEVATPSLPTQPAATD